jgi:putative ABC transport system permease protein
MVLRLRQDFDLTVEGSFALGGGVCAVLLIDGQNPLVAVGAAVAAGGICGAVTCLLNLWLDIPVLLAGLVMATGLFSVTLFVTELPSLSLVGSKTIFTRFSEGPLVSDSTAIIVTGVIVLAVLALTALFLKTEVGLALRASGVNEAMVRSFGASTRKLMLLSLVLSNALSAFGATLVVQTQGFSDANMGMGVFIGGVGALMLGLLILRPGGSQVLRIVGAVLIGTLLYRLILVGSLRLGTPANDLKGVMALTLILAVVVQKYSSIGLTGLRKRQVESRAAADNGVVV